MIIESHVKLTPVLKDDNVSAARWCVIDTGSRRASVRARAATINAFLALVLDTVGAGFASRAWAATIDAFFVLVLDVIGAGWRWAGAIDAG
jgi:hypothetical protein